MTLEQQIRPHTQYWDCYNDEPDLYNHTGKVLKIADEFATGFGEWCLKIKFEPIENISVKRLLEIYKKEKGL
jgi:hypothetical protein